MKEQECATLALNLAPKNFNFCIIKTLPITSYYKNGNLTQNIGEIHHHKENKTNGGKQIEFSAESNQFEKKQNQK